MVRGSRLQGSETAAHIQINRQVPAQPRLSLALFATCTDPLTDQFVNIIICRKNTSRRALTAWLDRHCADCEVLGDTPGRFLRDGLDPDLRRTKHGTGYPGAHTEKPPANQRVRVARPGLSCGRYRGSSRSRYQCRTTVGNHSSPLPAYRVIEKRLIVRWAPSWSL